MLLEDSRSFALLIPTYEGTPYLRRTLDYLRHIGFPGAVLLSDNSSGEHRAFVQSCAQRYPELRLEIELHPPETDFLHKLCRTLARLPARFVMLCGQDDFVVPAPLENILQRLAADPGLSAARGRVARFALSRSGAKMGCSLTRHTMREYTDPDPRARVLAHLSLYAPTFYSVHRRELLLESFQRTAAATRNVIFLQYLSSCITVFQGRVECTDELFYLRQAHADSWSGRLQQDQEHWPLLLTSPEYSRYYMEFRRALLDLLGAADTEAEVVGRSIDAAYVDLARRSLCQISREEPRDEAFFTRLNSAGSVERRQLDSVVAFSAAYRDTY
jgi:glycosyltransferase domain-containing protein